MHTHSNQSYSLTLQAMAVSSVYAGGVNAGAGGDCGVYRGGAGMYGMAAFHHHPQLHHHGHHHGAHPAAAWLAPYAALMPPAHATHHAGHQAHPSHMPIDSVPSQYVSIPVSRNSKKESSEKLHLTWDRQLIRWTVIELYVLVNDRVSVKCYENKVFTWRPCNEIHPVLMKIRLYWIVESGA